MKQLIGGVVIGAVVVGGVWFFSSQSKTVADVGGVKITQQQFDDQMEKTQGKNVLTQLVDYQVIRNEAKKLNITASDKEVQAKIDDLIKNRFNNDKSNFEKTLKENGITEDDVKSDFTVQVLAEKIATKDITVSDKEIQDYYDKNKATLGTPEQVHAKHILVKDEATANKIIAQLKANPGDWDKLCAQYSIDTSNKDKGGDLGTFGKGAMVPEFEKAAFAAKVNDIVGPVKTQFGYHIIDVLSHQDAHVPTLADVKDKITQTLKQQKAKPYQQLIQDLRKKETITINLPQFKSILDPAPAAPQPQQSQPQPQQKDSTAPVQPKK